MNSVVTPDAMQVQLQRLRKAQRAGGFPDANTRKDRLQRCINLLVENQEDLVTALDEDYGGRSPYLSKMSEIVMPIGHLKHAIKHVQKWMRPEKRSAAFPMGFLGGRARVEYQPLGVVGIMSPWNFPMAMIFHPLANALAAGNRVMIKPSEFNPKTAALLETLFRQYFSDEEIVVVNGGPEAGAAFSALPLDHIIFTGASGIGKMVMEAAARNLTPDKLPADLRSPLEDVCDQHLGRLIQSVAPAWVIGIGGFAEKCGQRVVKRYGLQGVQVGRILHPSPASPAANKDWSGTVKQQLQALGIV